MKRKLFYSIFTLICLIGNPSLLEAQSRSNGVKQFYRNFQNYEICLGNIYGCHEITDVSFKDGFMVIHYTYKNGKLSGDVLLNGKFQGKYRTSSTMGEFYLRFSPDGTARGSWASKGFFSFSDKMSIDKKF